MSNAGKRSHDDDDGSSSTSSRIKLDKKPNYRPHHHSYGPDNVTPPHQIMGKHSNFNSCSGTSPLPPKVRILCDIIAKTPALNLERFLEETGMRVSQEDVEEVLKLSYSFPGAAVKFFRWASGSQLNRKHGPKAWNLAVDLLGKNCLFDAMWDALKSMRKELLVSLSTFHSIFSSYVAANRVQEAIMSFEVIDQYGVPKDTVAFNSLLRAICKEGKTQQAKDYLNTVKEKIKVDAETYRILLDGWEKERDVDRARQTFSEMIIDIGWEKRNISAYDSFLCTLLKGPDGLREVLKFFDTMTDRGCFPGMKFFKLAIDECARKSDAKCAKMVWETMVWKNICRPDVGMYKSLISLYCNIREFSSAEKLLDEMVYNGVFPDSETYSMMFHFLIKHRRLRDATPIFREMVKNECVPLHDDCSIAVKAYIDSGDTHMAIKVWRFMAENYSLDLEETGNLLVVGLRNKERVPEAVKCAEDMIERGIKVNSATLSKLKQSLSKVGKANAYEELLCKWKTH